MKLLRAAQFASIPLLLLAGLASDGFAQSIPPTGMAAASATAMAELPSGFEPVRAFPSLSLGRGLNLSYIGMFTPDAVFRVASKSRNSAGPSLEEAILPASLQQRGDVPPSMLISTERVIEDFEPPARAVVVAHGHTRLGELRNRFLTYAYGPPSVLYSPRHVVTDSQERVIISDPAGNALHVLDPKGKVSFRIVCGKNRRLREPSGVAVDAADNIYVADAERGLVVVFNRNGGFLRYIGNFHGEPQYARPTGLAIDRERQRIYLADTPRNLIFVLSLDGNLIKRLGRVRDGSGYGDFDEPTEIAVNHEQIFILDARGTRIHLIKHDGSLMSSFQVPRGLDPDANRENGLGTDRDGNVYVSSFHSSTIRVFRGDGLMLAVFGEPGHSSGEFLSPGGLWINSRDRLYVADSGNGRVQLFQLKNTEHASSTDTAAETPLESHSPSSEDKSTLVQR